MLWAVFGSVFDARIARDLRTEGFAPQSGGEFGFRAARVAARTCRQTQSNVLADTLPLYCFAPWSTATRGRVHDK